MAGLNFAKQHGFHRIIIEIDSKDINNLLSPELMYDNAGPALLEDIKKLLSSHLSSKCNITFRKEIILLIGLLILELISTLTLDSFYYLLESYFMFYYDDKIGIVNLRH